MGVIRDIFFGRPSPVIDVLTAAAEPPSTDVAPRFTSIDTGTLYGVQTLDDALAWVQGASRVSRREAIQVTAVKRARDLIAGGLGQLPLRMYDADNKVVDWSLLSQPEEGVASTVTWTNVIDDLIFNKHAFLRVKNLGWHGLPADVTRLDPESVTIRPDLRVYYTGSGNGTAQEWVPDGQLIRIDSPNDALLVAGARAIRALGYMEQAGLNAAGGSPPMDYFTPAEGVDPADDDEIVAILDAWKAARKSRSTGYVPAALKYNSNGFSPEQMQLVQAREFAITEIARLTGVDAEDLGVSTTSRTYFNAQDRRRYLIDLTFGPYMRAVEAALSMDTVTPRGFRVRFDTSDFGKADDLTSAQTDEVLIRSRVMTVDEVRARRGLEPLPAAAPAQENAHDDANA